MSHRLQLPDGRYIALDEATRDILRAGVLVTGDVTVAEAPAVWQETETVASRLHAEHAGQLPSEIPGLKEARDLYRSFGMDPSRHRPSSEALLRRVLKDKELYRISSAVDCCNLASLSFLLPIGMYDLDRVAGDVILRTGRQGEEFPGIRKGPVHLAGRLGLFDDTGGFGSPTSDSARTCVEPTTRTLLAVIMATSRYDMAKLAANVALLADLFRRHCGGVTLFDGILGE